VGLSPRGPMENNEKLTIVLKRLIFILIFIVDCSFSRAHSSASANNSVVGETSPASLAGVKGAHAKYELFGNVLPGA